MSDARSLLRAHRAANRIEHPHAAYSDAGKLLCKICHEAVKSETLWDNHLRSTAHRQRLTALQSSRPAPAPTAEGSSTTTNNNNKRKHGVDGDDDVEMGKDGDGSGGDVAEDAVRRKKSRLNLNLAGTGSGNTPPGLTGRTSNKFAHGVEIAIPSRPATPLLGGEGSGGSTPRLPSHGRSPLNGSGSDSNSTPNTSHGGPALPTSSTTDSPLLGTAAPGASISSSSDTAMAAVTADGPSSKSVDEAEWALFEAEIAHAEEPAPPLPHSSSLSNNYNGNAAVISAPALTADQVAAKSQEEENERRKLRFDAQIADEREDATRALEDEFDEMEELEARVRRLKEKREQLRKGSMANLRAATAGSDGGGKPATKAMTAGKENTANGGAEDSDEDEDDDEDDDDDWDDGFRFRA